MAVGAHQREPPPVQTPGNHRRPGPPRAGQLPPAVPVRRHRRSKGAVMSWIEWCIEWLNSNQGLIAAVATVVIAIFAIITAWLTKALADDNRLMRKAGTEPEVVVYLTTNPRYPQDIFFVLANVGRGPAKNVEFTLQGDMNDFETHQVTTHHLLTIQAVRGQGCFLKVNAFSLSSARSPSLLENATTPSV